MGRVMDKMLSNKMILNGFLTFNVAMAIIIALQFYNLYFSNVLYFGTIPKAPWFYQSKSLFAGYQTTLISFLLASNIIALSLRKKDEKKSILISGLPLFILVVKLFF